MKNLNKIFSIIAIVFLLSSVAFVATTQNTNAAVDTRTLKTYAFIAVNPNPIGVGQPLQVSFWLADPPPTAAGSGGDRWQYFTVTITKPDGSNEIKSGYKSDAVGAAYFTYYPSVVGTYTFKVDYSGQLMTGIGQGSFTGITGEFSFTYLSSTATTRITVQQDAVQNPPQTPLPTSYWTRPINGQNLDWAQVSGNWLMPGWNSTARGFDSGSAYTPEGVMPQSSHVLWTKELSFGGQVGGVYSSAFFHDGRSYEYWFKPPVIISGRLYYNSIGANEPSSTGNMGASGIVCVDLETGETLWTIANTSLTMGQIYNYVSPNQAGAFAYLWSNAGSNWRMFDAYTGTYILTIANVTTGTTTFGPYGEIVNYNLAYNSTLGTYVLTKWNSSRTILSYQGVGSAAWQWRPYSQQGRTLDGNRGIEWQMQVYNISGQALSSFLQAGMYDGNTILSLTNGIQLQGMNMANGQMMYNSTLNVPTNIPAIDGLIGIGAFQNTYVSNGVFYEFLKATMQWIAYDVRTGQVKWTTESYDNAWGMYVPSCIAAYGRFYAGGYDGILHCYDISNGDLLWTYSPGSAGFQTPYGVWPIYSGLTVADGKVIFTTSEHGNGVEPLYTGEKLYVVDAYTGDLAWSSIGWFEQMAIADGKLLSHNCYDNRLYAFGKGPSATTIEAPLAGVTVCSNLVIQGTVTDQSIGAKGTPAISDANMEEWMAYIYQQQALRSEDIQGVPVQLTAIDANGVVTDLGTVTSDMMGNYAVMWSPQAEGMYTIIAAFDGSNSYYGSSAETHIAVSAATSAATPAPTETPAATETPIATATPTVAPQPDSGIATETLLIAGAAVVIVVAVIAAALVLRKRK